MNTDIGRYAIRLLVAVLIIAMAFLVWRIVDVLLLVFGAVLLAVLLRSLSDVISRYLRLPSGWSLAAAVLLLILGLAACGWLFGRELSAQVDQLTELVPQAWHQMKGYLQQHAWGRLLLDQLKDIDAGSLSDGVVGSAGSVLMTTIGAVGNALQVAAGALYLAAQPRLYRNGMVALVPRRAEERTSEALDAAGHGLRQWLKGQLVSMTAIGVLTTLGLWVLGVPSAFALGLLAGLAEFNPLVGPIRYSVANTPNPKTRHMQISLYMHVSRFWVGFFHQPFMG